MSLKFIGAFSVLVGLLLGIQGKDLTLQSVTGTIQSDNFTYYTLSYDGPISLILDSLEGDADLYISQYLLHPSYNFSEYCLHSASCGQDRVDIPSSFQRPIGIAVYGHPYYLNSTYRLRVVLRDELELVQDIGDDVILDSDEQDPRKVKVPGIGNVKDSEGEEHGYVFFTSLLSAFLEILLELLFA